ncbi:hypothetical protein [Pseudomonas oligotrophica]|uniref:hypothetical protein n=1 Tax=Pseudomonas oligotrophica TaxID=2912055 RepID=UPI001F1EFA5E|nr:hypothetical protein [Pseudomonas oligotrophica]MCF7202359.1 hypothetical protein [Pseudomonas oligotrophica]
MNQEIPWQHAGGAVCALPGDTDERQTETPEAEPDGEQELTDEDIDLFEDDPEIPSGLNAPLRLTPR